MRTALLSILSIAVLAACRSTTPVEPLVLPTLDGAAVAPLDVPAGSLHVVVFITTDCPIANGFAPEIAAIAADHADEPVRLFLVHVDADLDRAAARAHAADYRLPGPILVDRDGALIRAIGATITPEAAVIGPGGELLYRGRIDDRFVALGRRRHTPRHRDLRTAIRAALAGEPIEPARTEAIGCRIPSRTTAPARSAR